MPAVVVVPQRWRKITKATMCFDTIGYGPSGFNIWVAYKSGALTDYHNWPGTAAAVAELRKRGAVAWCRQPELRYPRFIKPKAKS